MTKPTSGCIYSNQALSQNLESLPQSPEAGQVTYGSYLKVSELLSLQHPLSQPAHHDEMLFIVIHQAYELWFKLIMHELETAIHFLDQGATLKARHYLKRVVEIQKLLVSQIHILETMTPKDFLAFRDHLNPASGFQSRQFRELEFLAGMKDARFLRFFQQDPESVRVLQARLDGPDLSTAYFAHLKFHGWDVADELTKLRTLRTLYEDPDAHQALYLLSETLVDFDQYLSYWREHHVRVVERLIGFKKGTGGSSGAGYLRQTLSQRAFPLLWDVRAFLEKK